MSKAAKEFAKLRSAPLAPWPGRNAAVRVAPPMQLEDATAQLARELDRARRSLALLILLSCRRRADHRREHAARHKPSPRRRPHAPRPQNVG